MKKKGLLSAMLILLLLSSAVCVGAEEIHGYDGGYDYVEMGSYPYERDGTERPVLWRVLSVQNGQALLLTENIIDTSQVIFETDKKVIEKRTYRRLERYEDSDLCPYLATEVFDRMFGGDPVGSALIERPEQGRLFLLNVDELTNTSYGFTAGYYGENWQHKARSAKGTPYALKQRGLYEDQSGYSTYWVGTLHGGKEDYKLWLIGYNGHISAGAYTRVNVGIRPAVTLDLSLTEIVGGSGSKEDPYRIAWSGMLPVPAPEEAAAAPEEAAEAPAVNEPAEETADAADAAAGPSAPADLLPRGENTVVISLIGDCSIGDSAQFAQSSGSYHTAVDTYGYAWPFSTVYDYLAEDDLTVANLEAVLTSRTAHQDKMYYLRADKDHVNILKEGSVEAVNTVNNHMNDFHENGYSDSVQVLDEAGIGRFGTARGLDDTSYVKEIGGIRFGFTGFSYPAIENGFNTISKHITALKEQEGCDVVVVSLHWGRETHPAPESWQQAYAKKLINAGADVVWGHHPHVLQPVEFYKGKPILYSTGNFTFGTISDLDPATGIFRLSYDRNGEDVSLTALQVIPCETRHGGDYRPVVLTGQTERENVFKKLIMKKTTAGCQSLPEDFVHTGIVYTDSLQ